MRFLSPGSAGNLNYIEIIALTHMEGLLILAFNIILITPCLFFMAERAPQLGT